MSGVFSFLIPFLGGLLFLIPGLFDSTMMSRLAVYPLLASLVLYLGRKYIGKTHFLTGAALALLPAVSLLWSSSQLGGIPFAVRWFSFGVMITGFSGCVNRYGQLPLLKGLSAAAALTSLLIVFTGADSITGNPNRTGMVLALGFTASVATFQKGKWLSWLQSGLIIAGVSITGFLTGWIACLAGGLAALMPNRKILDRRLILPLILVLQVFFTLTPDFAGRIGPTLELRSRIWRCSAKLFQENIPLGTGIGSARLVLFTSAEPELRELAGENRRVDFLHSEPIALITEMGIPGLVLVVFLLFWFLAKAERPIPNSLLAAFWLIFATDLPLATPLGALPAALFFALVPGFSSKKLSFHWSIPVFLAVFSVFWGYMVVTGYMAMGEGRPPSSRELEIACERIPWEERAFLAAGHAHLAEGAVLAAIEDSETFTRLYPTYYKGWELRAMALSSAGRECSSVWARAAILYTGEATSPNLALMVLNGINSREMNPDTAMMLGETFCNPNRVHIGDLVGVMSGEQLLSTSGKLLILSEECRVGSSQLAAKLWFTAMAFAAISEEDIPAETYISLSHGIDLYHDLPEDWKQKADMYLELIAEKTGTGAGALSP